MLLRWWMYDVLAVRGHVKVWHIWRKYVVSVGSSVGVCWSFSSWQVRDREQVLASPGSASLVTPAVEAGASSQTHTTSSLWSLVGRSPNLPSGPGWWCCWRLSVDNCEKDEGDINPARYKMCSTLLDSLVEQWPKSSIPHSRQFVYFCPQIALCPCHMLRVFTRGDEPVPVQW